MELNKHNRVGIALLVFSLFTATLYCAYTYVVAPDAYHFQTAATVYSEDSAYK